MNSSNMLNDPDFNNLLLTLEAYRHRQLIWIKGDVDWCYKQVLLLLTKQQQQLTQPMKGSWVQAEVNLDTLPKLSEDLVHLPASKARHRLGSEQDVLVIDAFSGLNPDALGALAGTLKAGGVLYLLTPEDWSASVDPDYKRLAAWPLEAKDLTHYFVQRCERLLIEKQVPRFSQQQEKLGNWAIPNVLTAATVQPKNQPSLKKLLWGAVSEEQSTLVTQLVDWFASKPVVPLVITANRGRGKSGALGLLLRELIQQPTSKKLLVTAPSSEVTTAIFDRIKDLPLELQEQVSFIAPDALLEEQPHADLLLVDEAAALPVPILKCLLAAYPKSVFATTQEGYEGNGRGFALRFTQHLNKHTPNWLALTLSQPLRWAEGDPLEKLINRLLLLDAQVTDPAKNSNKPSTFTWIKQADLLRDEALLQQVFGLLVLAHYRTTPDDFRQLLDAPGIHLACAWQGDLPIGLALIQEEGGFDAELAQAIFMGKRRPQGHLLAQSLAFHGGFVQAAQVNWWRIQRVLVHPLLQRQGIGKQLLSFVLAEAKQQPALDLIGSSFGATTELLPFWFRGGYQPVRLGITKDQASGEHTLQVVQGISVKGKALQQQLVERFSLTLPDALTLWLKALPADLLITILQALPLTKVALSEQDQLELDAFAEGHRPLAVSRTVLKNWLWQALAERARSSQLVPWVQLLLQEVPELKLQQQLGLKGRKAFDRWLRNQLKTLLE
ncbi:tRNA(Met) cytidine acetyltransferase TmcA [Marinospirillum insulare]|uniref:tRNA(Met) cytidine acetyltransferase TmcA n=1 Tax=Marinospirillum insulare TaxID=217169 RepID=A0ABQ6A331_9GAMM|nr:GNAT family N-acetyltransferase [Marinospirillum insulare]GLR64490.1 tRNA(Met) cytidine acetyltransferase TmcA [Marinospirillum insulare]